MIGAHSAFNALVADNVAGSSLQSGRSTLRACSISN